MIINLDFRPIKDVKPKQGKEVYVLMPISVQHKRLRVVFGVVDIKTVCHPGRARRYYTVEDTRLKTMYRNFTHWCYAPEIMPEHLAKPVGALA